MRFASITTDLVQPRSPVDVGASRRTRLQGLAWPRRARTGGPRCRRGRRRPSWRCRPPRPWPGRPPATAIDASSWATVSAARAWASGLLRRQRSSSAPRIVCSTFLNRPSRSFMSRARDLAGGIPLVGQVAERVQRGLRVGRPAAASRPRRAAPRFTSALAAYSASSLAFVGVAGAEEGVLGGAEPLPQRVVDVLLRARRRPSTASSGRGRRARSRPSRSSRRAPRPRRPASP